MTGTALVRRLLPYAWRRRGSAVLVLVAMLLQVGVTALAPWPMKVIVDNALGGRPLEGRLGELFVALPGPETREAILWWAAGATLMLFLLGWAIGVGFSWAGVRFGERMTFDLAGDLLSHLQRLSLRYHTRAGVGSSIRRVTTDTSCVSTIVQGAALPLVVSIATLVTMLVIMLALDPVLTGVALLVIPAMVVAMRRLSAPMIERSYEQQLAEGELYETIEQTITGLPVVQAFGREDAGDARFAADTRRILAATMSMTWAQYRFRIFVAAATAVGTAVVMLLGALRGLDGALTVGTILVFLAYLGSLYGPLHEVTETSATVSEAAGSARRVLEVFDIDPEVDDRPGAVAPDTVRGHVRFEDVGFAYEPGREVLDGISFEAKPGEVVAVVGETGAGKTTLVSMVARFFDPDRGRVLLDGHDLRDLPVRTVRDSVSLVLQESFLFPTSIMDNIRYGRPDAHRREVIAAARDANAHDFISRLPKRYRTQLGERGATLSGGERQRVAIARALLSEAPILILDEPTSALDAETEALIMQALGRLMRGRTTFIIAHRLSTVRRADRILVLDRGRIVEQGTHAELMAQGGRYARMHEVQFGPVPAAAPA